MIDVSYRLIPETNVPGMQGDVKRAIAWVKRNGEHYGVKPDRIALGGGSRGSHWGCSPPALQFVGDHDAYVGEGRSTPALRRKLHEVGVPSACVAYPRTDHAFDSFLPTISPVAQSALHDVDRLLALMASPANWKTASLSATGGRRQVSERTCDILGTH